MEQLGAYKITEGENAVNTTRETMPHMGFSPPQDARSALQEQFSKTRLIPESQIEALVEKLVKQKLAEMLGVTTTDRVQRQWYDTDTAYSLLGLNSDEQLRVMVRDGTLRVGIEVRDVRSPSSQIPRYQFHIEKCEARLVLPPEKRQVTKAKKTA
ncbi:MAG: hypothetical protein V7K21_19290 [Nostoc sp.]|uniref:hypothetical protein n=1 Tax=Nostoc sp. TaxID=1180 RepID=UPI002FF8E0B3